MALAVSRPEPRNEQRPPSTTVKYQRARQVVEKVVEQECHEAVSRSSESCAGVQEAESSSSGPAPPITIIDEVVTQDEGDNDLKMIGYTSNLVTEEFETTETAPAAESTPESTSSQLSPEMVALRDKLRQVLKMYYPRHQNTRDNTPWEVMHAIIAYGCDTQLFKGGPGGEKVNAVGWMCYNRPMGGEQMLLVNNGSVEARRGPGVQGHFGQFLAILAQSHVKIDFPMQVSGKNFTLADLLAHEKANCTAGEELTFKLIALMHYGDSDEVWKSRDGQNWSIQRLVFEELKQPIRGAACGGTHRLMGLSYAVNKRIQRGQPVIGEFHRAQKFIQDYHSYTFSLQNPDGSFSTEWFTRRGNANDVDRKLKTSGHILEWTGFSLTPEELQDPRMIKAVDFVATILLKNDNHKWEIGPLGHGLHALMIYHDRMFKDSVAEQPQTIATAPQDEAAIMLEARRVSEMAD